MTVKMSSEGDSSKNLSTESKEKNDTDSKKSDVKSENNIQEDDNNKTTTDDDDENVEDDEKKENNEMKTEKDEKSATTTTTTTTTTNKNDVNKSSDKKEEKETKGKDTDDKETTENDEESERDEEEGSEKDEDEDDDKEVPLLDQPLEKSGKRERKNVQRFEENTPEPKENAKVEIPNGSGTQLGNIPRVDASISRFKNDDMKLLHRVLFKTPGKTIMIKKNIKRFNGFDFKRGSDDYTKKFTQIQKFELKQLKSICEMLDLQKTGTKDEIIERIIDFLLEPKDTTAAGKTIGGGGRPKRTAAVKANNRGYSSHDNYSSDERHSSRTGRDKGKRSNLKDDSSSQSDEDFQPSDASDEKPRVNRRGRRRKNVSDDDDDDEDEDEMSEEETASSEDESDDEPKNKRKKVVKANNNKAKGKTTGAKRGRKPAAASATTAAATKKSTRGRKPRKESSDDEDDDEEEEESDHKQEEEEEEEEGSTSEDEPLAKKAKTSQPPTDDEIKSYVKEILEGANLEQITMKTVCQQVYAHYPDFDLAHKKDFIKTTVKSLIST